MLLRKQMLIVLCLVLAGRSALAQTSFDTSGKLEKINWTSSGIDPAATPLPEIGMELKQQVRDLLLRKTQEAIRVIRANNYKRSLHKFYLQVWNQPGDSANLLGRLLEVETALQSGSLTAYGGVNRTFSEVFNRYVSDTAQVFRWRPTGTRSGVLLRNDVFQSFVADYYNASLPSLAGAYARREDIVEASYYLLEQNARIRGFLGAYRSSISHYRKSLFDSLVEYHAALVAPATPLAKARQLLRSDWIAKWFWFTGGEIRINPIDFRSDTLVRKVVSDLSKMSGDLLADLPVERRLDTLEDLFRASNPSDAVVGRWINKVALPDQDDFFQFSATGDIKYPNDARKLRESVHADDSKVLVIHNIPADRKANLRQDRKAIPDRSAFQEGLDGAVAGLGQLALAYKQVVAAPWSLVADFLLPRPNYRNGTITAQTISMGHGINDDPEPIIVIRIQSEDSIELSGKSSSSFFDALSHVLSGPGPIKQAVFTKIFSGVASATFADANDPAFRVRLKAMLGHYYEEIMQQAAAQVQEDSLLVAGMLRIYNTATEPLQKAIRLREDQSIRYYSATLETAPSDTTVELQVRPYTLSKANTDTAFLTSFSYRIGKPRRFTLGAGIAYTLNAYDQSVAKAENGTIGITNNNQLFRFMVGMQVYFGKGLYNFDKGLGQPLERWFGFVGIGIPKPLENVYLGVGRDLYPGLKLAVGVHVARQNKYLIENNQIVEERLRYQAAGPFVSVMIDPGSFISLLNVFKKS